MARRLVLHIGTMKSGTSFIQNVLQENRAVLAEHGVLFPGRRWRDQVSGVLDLIERGGDRQEPMAAEGPWRRIAAEVNGWPDTAVISMEFLAPRTRPKILQILSCFPGAEVDVVLTARDLSRNIPAMWQESVQNAGTTTWEEFLEAVRTGDKRSPTARWFWRHQGVPGIVRRWTNQVGRQQFWLVTVPPPGAPQGLLWERFAETLGVPADRFRLDVRRNPSIGAASAMVMRQVNERLADDPLPRQVYQRYAKHLLAKEGLGKRPTREDNLALDAPWVMKRGAQQVEALRRLRPRVVGDLADLSPRAVPGVRAAEVTVEDQLAAAVDGLAHVVRQWAGGRGRRPRRGPRHA
jgi:hypothetical protein